MTEKIYLIDDARNLHPMDATPFGDEETFQSLLEDFPDLLTGDNVSAGKRWLLVSREMPIADAEGASGRWSLDHLFLDADGVPTLVEVKRSSDTRIRREVVGQMLDYAANAVVYWPIERIQTEFEKRCDRLGCDPSHTVLAFLAGQAIGETSEEAVVEFWSKVETNLNAERIRMVFVADEVPTELARIVEFLNGQMRPAEVVALELKQYTSDTVQTLVPRVIGRTAKAATQKIRRAVNWDRQMFIDEVRRNGGDEAAVIAERAIDWFESETEAGWGKGSSVGYFYANVTYQGKQYSPVALTTHPAIEVSIWGLRDFPELRKTLEAFRRRLNAINGVDLRPVEALHHQQVPLAVIAASDQFDKLKEAWRALRLELNTPDASK